ncbi:hypothetical protein [Micromonospora sp. WMMD987]|jgi:hypothetical protein|uniref:hypothetical protein n=1 Tax=Micromonospora TaxID=1873 RepID=UPI00249A17DC|nr:hypothetical protein [Micromonospora sp. WMMD987]WFE93901.1 hypothetical protein O7612_21250 [Micromonospora sp. WMMD987]
MRVRKLLATLAIAFSAVAGTVVVTSAPAQAGTCGTPYCGGVVVSRGASVGFKVTNTWCSSLGAFYVGNKLSCVSKPDNWYAWNADATLNPGQNTASRTTYYYDVDAFAIPAGCQMWWYFGDNTQGLQTDRAGSVRKWFRIADGARVSVTRVSC